MIETEASVLRMRVITDADLRSAVSLDRRFFVADALSLGSSLISRDGDMDVVDWLRSLGLERYQAAFRQKEIDGRVLRSLTAQDLADLGVTLIGRRLLDAIAALGNRLAVPSGAPVSAIRRPMRMTPSGRCAPLSRW
jgi:hypothetical protein